MSQSKRIIPFYGERDEYGCFSNYYMAKIHINGYNYCCNEQYIMHQKALLFDDKNIANKIMSTCVPRQIKSLGRQVKNFDEVIWATNREKIAFDCNLAKFTQHASLTQILKDTGSAIIVEASPTDCIWGVGVNKKDALDIKQWKGKNLLGNSLMKVREKLFHI